MGSSGTDGHLEGHHEYAYNNTSSIPSRPPMEYLSIILQISNRVEYVYRELKLYAQFHTFYKRQNTSWSFRVKENEILFSLTLKAV